jgi:C-terminal processing protease CtpA/Prc
LEAVPYIQPLTDKLYEAEWADLLTWWIECPSGDSLFFLLTDESRLPLLRAMGEEHDHLVTVVQKEDLYLLQMADTSWINESFLGAELAAALSEFRIIPVIDWTEAAVGYVSTVRHTNQNPLPDMDFNNENYRLLGLFRLWNTMEYHFPYRDILDRDWSDLVLEHIPVMLEGSDRLSYELTIASLASNLHDAHIWFNRRAGIGGRLDSLDFLAGRFGRYRAALQLVEAEGRLVVCGRRTGTSGHSLRGGDVIVRLDGICIYEVAAEMLRYLPYPTEQDALAYLAFVHSIIRSHERNMTVDIIRDGVEMTMDITGRGSDPAFRHAFTTGTRPHFIFPEYNIGVINPQLLSASQTISHVMSELAETDGLIIDLRQNFGHTSINDLTDYIVHERHEYFTISLPLNHIPGVFFRASSQSAGGIQHDDRPRYYGNVVVLINEHTQSWGETMVMQFRYGANVTVIGSNTIGANGNVSVLPLPGSFFMVFTGIGVYTADGGQTQRIGLPPDIFVRPTIEGLREGRDEVMEAAVEFLRGL